MELRNSFIETNELVDSNIKQYKEAVISDGKFAELTINLLMYIEAVFSLETPALKDVAKHLNVTNASASIAVQKLIDSGFLNKQQSFEDKRVYRIHLTQKSIDLMKKEKAAKTNFWDGFISTLSLEEQSLLNNIFTKIIISQGKRKA